jgi:hypothetical protein
MTHDEIQTAFPALIAWLKPAGSASARHTRAVSQA